MDSFAKLSPLQADLLRAFFDREQRFVLTGGAALAGFHLGHRTSMDLDLFARPPTDLETAQRALEAAAIACGAQIKALTSFPHFHRLQARRGDEMIIVDLVIDETPQVDTCKAQVGSIRIDSLREIAANKICTLIGRSEIRDLVDLQAILGAGLTLESALADASLKDSSVNPATLAWILDELRIHEDAPVPGPSSAAELDAFRQQLVGRLRRLALPKT